MASAAQIFRNWKVDGVPSSGEHEPVKAEIREWAQNVESSVEHISVAAAIFDTRSSLLTSLGYAANTRAWVVSDPTPAYNGIYRKTGASGSGSWSRVLDLPFDVLLATNTNSGDPNTISATTVYGAVSGSLVILPIVATNTSTSVSVAFNGGDALTIKAASGVSPIVGGIRAGMLLVGLVNGAEFRMLGDQTSSDLITPAEAAAAAAEAARDVVLAALVSINLPSLSVSDAGKALVVNAAGDGYDAKSNVSRTATQATTSGSSKDFAIPTWASRIVVNINGVSTTGVGSLILQLGTGGSPETSGYLGSVNDGSNSYLFSTGVGFFDAATNAAIIRHGQFILDLVDRATNTWSVSIKIGFSNAAGNRRGAGTKTLAGALNMVRVLTSDAFDAGLVGVSYS